MNTYAVMDVPGTKAEFPLNQKLLLTYREAIVWSGKDYMLREIRVNGRKLTHRDLNDLVQPDDKIMITFPAMGSGPRNETESKTQSE
jgi:hypothetical protein